MTKEQFDILSRFKSNFDTIETAGYTRNINKRDREILLKIYRELVDENFINIYCHNCFMDMMRKLGKVYHDYTQVTFCDLVELSQPKPITCKPHHKEPKPRKKTTPKTEKDDESREVCSD